MRTSLQTIATVVFLSLVCTTTMAAFPDRAIKITVPFAAGGGTDIKARALQEPMRAFLGTDIVVTNTAGGGGTIGVAEVAKARPDGYNLGLAPVGPLTTQTNLRKLPYDIDSFEYVCLTYSVPSLFAVKKDSPFTNLADLISYAKAHPGALTFAIPALGSVPHLAVMAFAREAKIEINYLPVAGDAPSLKALLDGSADAFIPGVAFYSQNKDQIRSVALIQPDELPDLPELITAKSQGYDLDFPVWGGLVAPKGTPQTIIEQLSAACDSAIHSESYTSLLEKFGEPVRYMNASDFDDFVRKQYLRNKELLQGAGFNAK